MSKEVINSEQRPQGRGERFWRLVRNVNAIGAIAFLGAGALIGSAAAAAYGGFNALQAAGAEWMRQRAEKQTIKKPNARKLGRLAFDH